MGKGSTIEGMEPFPDPPEARRRIGLFANVTFRPALPEDQPGVRRLAALDSSRTPPGPYLLAEVNGTLRAAYSLIDDSVVADPFSPTADLVELLADHVRRARLAGAR